ncbi:methyl-accepting chemotaxis protein McpA [Pullulanibacillus camelliae]|uniref:Methyl-accepting chemotaxis protein McpA n=1 Tax=Pullulanibacillus camelliae TaxID=1707096 RepID=A0A8J2VPQ9_9BACL|nr:methyl-accepting chemotaxis protein [Pullulanibacillus camelliae]GGE34603.1 methyl-accepting chemotaxis protein McpA [Pullulanibacillus camelliae]
MQENNAFKRAISVLFHLSLKAKLTLSFLVILIVPLVVSNWISYKDAENTVDSQMMNSEHNSVNIVNQTIDQFISAQEQNIDYLAQAIPAADINNNENKKTREILNKIQKSSANVEQTYVGTETGSFMNEPTSFKNPPDYDPRKRPWYQDAMKANGKVIITDPYVSQSSKQMVVTIAQKTQDGQGVAAVNLRLDSITNMLSSIKVGQHGYLSLLDKNNMIISDPKEKEGTKAKGSFYKTIHSGNSGDLNVVHKGKQERLSYETNKLTGWKIIGTMYQDEVDQAVHPILTKTIIVLVISLILAGLLIFLIIRSITRPLALLMDSADKVSEGDLRAPVVIKTQDEIGQLGHAFERMRTSLIQVVSEIESKATSLAASSEELSASTNQNSKATEQITQSIQELSLGAERQSRKIDESTQSAIEMVTTIQEISESSNEVASTAINTSNVVNEGNEAVEVSVQQMQFIKNTVSELAEKLKTLGEYSANIDQIINVITEIADQTNLLALNAAIEAARAGEQGKGFAVVADEVRKLAEQSSQSTDKIREVVTAIQKETDLALQSMETGKVEVDKGIDVVNSAGESFKNIKQFVDNVTSQIQNVSAAVQEIAASTEQNVRTFEDISEISKQTSAGTQDVSATTEEQLASMEEISSSAENLSEMAEELQGIIERFKI